MRTVNEILDRFATDYVPTLRPATQRTYVRCIQILRQEFGQRVAADLRPSDFAEFMNAESGKIHRNRTIAVLSAAFNLAVREWRYLEVNVCTGVMRNPVRVHTRALTDAEFATVRSHAPERIQLAMDLALLTGQRHGDLLALRWTDVDDDFVTFHPGSAPEAIRLPIVPRLRATLERCRAIAETSDYVLPTETGERYTPSGHRAMWQRLMRRLAKQGIRRFTFHDIRAKALRNRSHALPSDVQDAVDQRMEALRVEYKEWLDLGDNVQRAKIARHLAALSNAGGGYLIFGIRDDGTSDPRHPGDLSSYSAAEFASIIDKYLSPTFQCETFAARSSAGGDECLVVRVPTMRNAPICAKAGGPNDSRGRPQGIQRGVYYTRAPGPRSVAIDTPELWAPVIRRAIVNEREALLKGIANLLGSSPGLPRIDDSSGGPKSMTLRTRKVRARRRTLANSQD